MKIALRIAFIVALSVLSKVVAIQLTAKTEPATVEPPSIRCEPTSSGETGAQRK